MSSQLGRVGRRALPWVQQLERAAPGAVQQFSSAADAPAAPAGRGRGAGRGDGGPRAPGSGPRAPGGMVRGSQRGEDGGLLAVRCRRCAAACTAPAAPLWFSRPGMLLTAAEHPVNMLPKHGVLLAPTPTSLLPPCLAAVAAVAATAAWRRGRARRARAPARRHVAASGRPPAAARRPRAPRAAALAPRPAAAAGGGGGE